MTKLLGQIVEHLDNYDDIDIKPTIEIEEEIKEISWKKKAKVGVEGLFSTVFILISAYIMTAVLFFGIIQQFKLGQQEILFVYSQISSMFIGVVLYVSIFKREWLTYCNPINLLKHFRESISENELKFFILFAFSVFLGGSIAFGINDQGSPGQVAFELIETDYKLTVLSIILTGFIEEVIFRGIFQSKLRKVFSKYTAVILPSLVFSVAHVQSLGGFSPKQMIALFTLGCVWGYIYERTENLAFTIACHSSYNVILINTFFFF